MTSVVRGRGSSILSNAGPTLNPRLSLTLRTTLEAC
jgi:hypothetical protein